MNLMPVDFTAVAEQIFFSVVLMSINKKRFYENIVHLFSKSLGRK